MEFNHEMNLISEHGYCMPFDGSNDQVVITREYGAPKNEDGSEGEFHHGVDFATNRFELAALADGVVTGLGVNRKEHGPEITIKYDKYEVTYAGISELYVEFGKKVSPGQTVALSGDVMHLEVKFSGTEIDPMPFLTMLYENAVEWASVNGENPSIPVMDLDIHTKYDKDQQQIEGLMIKYLGNYMEDMATGRYQVPQQSEQAFRNLLAVGQQKNYFFETMPSNINPMGLTARSMPMLVKAQTLIIQDFLNYLMIMQQIMLGEDGTPVQMQGPADKKKVVTNL